jgi:hypothetical protein
LKLSLAPEVFIASYTIFKLSIIVSNGQINVPSGEYLRAASPPFPLVIDFLIFCIIFVINGRAYLVFEIR